MRRKERARRDVLEEKFPTAALAVLDFRAACAPDAVDVILRMLRHVVIDDVAHLRDVESARGDVRGDERFELAVAETAQGLLAFALGAVGMQHGHGMIGALEQAGDWSAPCLVRQKIMAESYFTRSSSLSSRSNFCHSDTG